jgi:hypothetical protein
LLAFYSKATKCKRSSCKLRGEINFTKAKDIIKAKNPTKAENPTKDFKEGFFSQTQ